MSDSEAADEAVVLRYRAKGEYIIGVPARDLTNGDLELIAASGRLGKTVSAVFKRLATTQWYAEPSTDAARKSAAPAADRKA